MYALEGHVTSAKMADNSVNATSYIALQKALTKKSFYILAIQLYSNGC